MRVLLAILFATLWASAAWADNPSPAYWQGRSSHVSGDAVCFGNSGQGITLQDAASSQCAFPRGVITSGTYNITSNVATVVPLWNTNLSSVTGTYNSSGTTGIWQNSIASFNVTKAGAAGISNTRVSTIVGGGSQTGGFLNLSSVLFVNATADTGDSFYVSDVGQSTCQGNVGGTGLTALGHCFGSNYYSRLTNGATNFVEEGGMEIDISTATGASTLYQEGIQVVLENANAVAATNWSSAYIASAQPTATATLSCAYCVGGYQGHNPLASTGTLFGYFRHNNAGSYPDATVSVGVDLQYVDTTVAAWRGPNSTSLISDLGTFTSSSGNYNAASNTAVSIGNVTNGVGLQVLGNGGNSDVNILTVQPSQTGQPVTLACGGPSSDANLNCNFTTKGTGNFSFSTGGGRQLQITNTASVADNLTISGSATGSPGQVQIGAAGTDTDITIQFLPKGAGTLKVGSSVGVSCSGSPTSSFASVDGIVTHC